MCLKHWSAATWGCDKETLLTTYQAIGRSILSYCCPVRTPLRMDTNWNRLQRAKTSAPRIATGCLEMKNEKSFPPPPSPLQTQAPFQTQTKEKRLFNGRVYAQRITNNQCQKRSSGRPTIQDRRYIFRRRSLCLIIIGNTKKQRFYKQLMKSSDSQQRTMTG